MGTDIVKVKVIDIAMIMVMIMIMVMVISNNNDSNLMLSENHLFEYPLYCYYAYVESTKNHATI